MPLRISKHYREAILHFLRTGMPRFQRLLQGSRRERKLARELLSKEKRRAGWDDFFKNGQKVSDDFMAGGREFHPERDAPALTPEADALRTLLTDHGSDAYNKLVRGAKVGPLF